MRGVCGLRARRRRERNRTVGDREGVCVVAATTQERKVEGRGVIVASPQRASRREVRSERVRIKLY